MTTTSRRYTCWDLTTLAASFLQPITELFSQPLPPRPAPQPQPAPTTVQPFADVELAPHWPDETPGVPYTAPHDRTPPGVPYTAPHDRTPPETMSAGEVREMMRVNGCTCATLAERLGVSVCRVRQVRERGLIGADQVAVWTEGIAGKNAGVAL